jgi:hypothetical protein
MNAHYCAHRAVIGSHPESAESSLHPHVLCFQTDFNTILLFTSSFFQISWRNVSLLVNLQSPHNSITQNHLLWGLCPSSGILTRKQWLRWALSTGPNRVGVSFPLPEDGNRLSFRNDVFYLFRIPDDGQGPQTQWFWVLYTIIRTL